MNWRRGLLLAGINPAIAFPMIAITAARYAQARRDWDHQSTGKEGPWIDSSGEFSVRPSKVVQVQEEQTVTFNLRDLRGRSLRSSPGSGGSSSSSGNPSISPGNQPSTVSGV